MDKKTAAKIRKREQRQRDKSVTDVTKEDVTHPEMSHPDVTLSEGFIGVARYLVDDEKRKKLKDICQALDVKDLGQHVRFGIEGPTMDVVGEMISIVEGK